MQLQASISIGVQHTHTLSSPLSHLQQQQMVVYRECLGRRRNIEKSISVLISEERKSNGRLLIWHVHTHLCSNRVGKLNAKLNQMHLLEEYVTQIYSITELAMMKRFKTFCYRLLTNFECVKHQKFVFATKNGNEGIFVQSSFSIVRIAINSLGIYLNSNYYKWTADW